MQFSLSYVIALGQNLVTTCNCIGYVVFYYDRDDRNYSSCSFFLSAAGNISASDNKRTCSEYYYVVAPLQRL